MLVWMTAVKIEVERSESGVSEYLPGWTPVEKQPTSSFSNVRPSRTSAPS